jgi:hypothetical protein
MLGTCLIEGASTAQLTKIQRPINFLLIIGGPTSLRELPLILRGILELRLHSASEIVAVVGFDDAGFFNPFRDFQRRF